MLFSIHLLSSLLVFAQSSSADFPRPHRRDLTCQKTTVAILGAGAAGITAAQALTNQSITDFLIVEHNGEIGGRVKHTTFGAKPDGSGPYVVELGANWVQGLGSDGGPENPIWTLAKRYNLVNTYSNYSKILTYNETGESDYSSLLDDFEDAFTILAQDAGYILTENLQDRSIRAGLSLSGWKPSRKEMPMAAAAVEWWEWDYEYAYTPEQSSQEFGITNYNTTFNQYSDENNFVFDERGFSAFIQGEASTFLSTNDSRLVLNTIVTNISYSDTGVIIYNSDNSCIEAEYAICTFSLGVLQNDVVTFEPELPSWKEVALASFQMGTYTKIFLQFNETFWPTDEQFLLYASPTTRGYYPVWQSLSTSGFLPGSNIIFVTVLQDESHRVERQSDATTQAEAMQVLREMFPDVDVPDPIAFMYPRWSQEPWAFGSYSNWPPGTTLEMHQNLRANVGRLYFAGEATSASYYGFLHGAYFEGKEVGERIAGMITKQCLNGNVTAEGDGNVTTVGVDCSSYTHYEVLEGTTMVDEYDGVNGWDVSSFLTYGLDV